MDVIEETAVAVPTKLAVSTQSLVIVGGTAIVVGAVAGVVMWKKHKARKAAAEALEETTN